MSKHNYKGVWVNSFGIPTSKPIFDRKKKGKDRVRDVYNVSFRSSFKKDSPKNLIVVYDIPEEKKKERDWFRRNLKRFGYILIQRSIWVGPSPLPENFIKYIKEIGLKDKIKVFKLAKEYSKNNNLLN